MNINTAPLSRSCLRPDCISDYRVNVTSNFEVQPPLKRHFCDTRQRDKAGYRRNIEVASGNTGYSAICGGGQRLFGLATRRKNANQARTRVGFPRGFA
jgi:hypothetical protein